MSLYVDFAVASKQNAGAVLQTQWCKTEQVLAIATEDNSITFYQEEGDHIPNADVIRSCKPSSMDWRPTSKVLASGWQDGAISLWSVQDKSEKEDRSVHSHEVTLLNWSPEGGRLLAGDCHGLVSVWKTDHRSRLAMESKYQIIADDGLVEPIVASTWLITPEYRDAQADLATPPQYFAVGGGNGSIVILDLKGQPVATQREPSSISHMFWYEERQHLVIITSDCVLSRYTVDFNKRQAVSLNLVSRVKLSMTAAAVKGGVTSAVWIAPGMLATCAAEQFVRFWDLENDENYMISLSSMHESDDIPKKDSVIRLSYNSRKKNLALGTRSGRVLLWHFAGDTGSAPPSLAAADSDPKSRPPLRSLENGNAENPRGTSGGVIRSPSASTDWTGVNCLYSSDAQPVSVLEWGPGEATMVSGSSARCAIFAEAVLHRTLRNDVAAVQVSAQRLLVRRGASTQIDLDVGIRVKGLDITDSNLVVWNRKKAEVYEFAGEDMRLLAAFPSKAEAISIQGANLYQATGNKLEVCNLQGVSTKSISFTEQEGQPRLVDASNRFLAVATSRGLIKLYDVSRREPRPIGSGKRFASKGSKSLLGIVRSIKCNSEGTRVSILCDRMGGAFLCEPDTKLHIWYPDKDDIKSFEFGPARYPTSHFWDSQEPRLVACEARSTGRYKPMKVTKTSDTRPRATVTNNVQIFTLFATDEQGKDILMQDSFPLDRGLEALLGLRVPRLFFITKPLEDNNGLPKLKGRTMRDFAGLDSTLDEETKRALINFSYFLAVGNMDEAYRAVKLIKNVTVWQNMAHMCVKTKRLDVAEICLGNMGHARGARALREAKKEPELEAKVAMVAIQLGLLDDAERLYLECGRYDLLNRMLQASGQWEKALEVASQYDRLHLRETHFKYAKYLESINDFAAATKNYEAAKASCEQVPRMLFEARRLDELEEYVQCNRDLSLVRWWGQLCESQGEYDRAIQIYSHAQDELSLVRVHCFLDDVGAASDVALNSTNPAASYFLARHFEQMGNEGVKQAMQFFSRAGKYNHSVRLAKQHGFDKEILNLALRASPAIMVEAAKYLEARGMNESAVLLYQKGGNVPRALDLCFRAQLFEQLRTIADSITDENAPEAQSSPEILSKCAQFFMKHEQYEKAVHLLITGKEFERALDLCVEHRVTISEDMAERMTLEKLSGKSKSSARRSNNEAGDERRTEPKTAIPQLSAAKAAEHDQRRQKLLMQLAKCCKKQGSYHLATKKYTQAGDKLKAMKCLLRSGDTEKITFFAGVSKRPDIYILAANYLQNLDWHNNPDIMKNIILFYTKARAFNQLSTFYDACAQVEIDEYSDYKKALGALKEAAKYLKKVQGTDEGKDSGLDALNQRISLVERFVHAQDCRTSQPTETEQTCLSLLGNPQIETAIRIGDIFALLVDHYYNERNMEQAFKAIERMRVKGISLGPYLDQDVVRAVYQSQGAELDFGENMGGGKGTTGSLDEESDDGIEEDIPAWNHK